MAEIKDKIVTVESLAALHTYNENTFVKKDGALTTLGVTATVDELNYIDGVTSNIQEQLDSKVAGDHEHNYLPLTGGSLTGDIVLANEHGRIYGVDYSKGVEGITKEILVGQTLEGNTSIGYGNYYEQSGFTNIYGDSIKMTSRTSGLFEREYGENKILWQGNLHMNGTQTIAFLDTVQHQPNGIVLVWSEYDPVVNTVYDQGFVTQFIPKILVALQPEKFHTFPFVIWSNQSQQIAKGLYISDDGITGHAINSDATDPAALVNSYVLRYVIGV